MFAHVARAAPEKRIIPKVYRNDRNGSTETAKAHRMIAGAHRVDWNRGTPTATCRAGRLLSTFLPALLSRSPEMLDSSCSFSPASCVAARQVWTAAGHFHRRSRRTARRFWTPAGNFHRPSCDAARRFGAAAGQSHRCSCHAAWRFWTAVGHFEPVVRISCELPGLLSRSPASLEDSRCHFHRVPVTQPGVTHPGGFGRLLAISPAFM